MVIQSYWVTWQDPNDELNTETRQFTSWANALLQMEELKEQLIDFDVVFEPYEE